MEAREDGSLVVPDWLLTEESSKRYIGGSDPSQEQRNPAAVVVKLGYKPTAQRSSNADLGDFTTFYG